ncbi:adenylyl-sulfate kinase [Castellaniella caeni]|uniref:adenylyl-sulfate kinase n=1 Tax=Castellaniella caeni TaxID=266123 RepID=UPI000832C029|nr:adenylyl-sulfate kinase [Castellaniella caeni]
MKDVSVHPAIVPGRVIWITGLSGAGKSTLAQELVARLRKDGLSVVLLDGDELRDVFGHSAFDGAKLDRAGRLGLALQYGKLCRLLALQGQIVVIATISMFHEVYAWNRKNIPGYFEVYLRSTIEALIKRDPKGIYRRFGMGEIQSVAGLDLPVDDPVNPDVEIVSDLNEEPALLGEMLAKKIDLMRNA